MGYWEEIVPCEGNDTQAHIVQRSFGCPSPGGVQSQVGRGLEQPGVLQVEGVPAHGGCWNEMVFKVPSNPNHFVILTYEHPRILFVQYCY